jgi:hypothetical protein
MLTEMESNYGRVLNGGGEVLATGAFVINQERQEITFRPVVDSSLLDRETGPLIMELDDGRMLELAAKYMRFRLHGPDGERQSIYRLRYIAGQEARGLPASR